MDATNGEYFSTIFALMHWFCNAYPRKREKLFLLHFYYYVIVSVKVPVLSYRIEEGLVLIKEIRVIAKLILDNVHALSLENLVKSIVR